MSARIDHVIDAGNSIANALHLAGEEEATSITHAMVANASATLALVEQQRIANMQVEVSRLRVTANHRAGSQSGADLSSQAYALEVQIREGLGL